MRLLADLVILGGGLKERESVGRMSSSVVFDEVALWDCKSAGGSPCRVKELDREAIGLMSCGMAVRLVGLGGSKRLLAVAIFPLGAGACLISEAAGGTQNSRPLIREVEDAVREAGGGLEFC